MINFFNIKYSFIIMILLQGCCVFEKKDDHHIDTKSYFEIVKKPVNSSLKDGYGKIEGVVLDEHSKKTISYAEILFFGDTNYYFMSDSLGKISEHLKLGEYRIKISSPGNKPLTIKKLKLTTTDKPVITFYLGTSLFWSGRIIK